MKFIGDFHVHTLASGDAFGTIQEIVHAAKEKGLEAIAITEHGPKMEASAHPYYFESLSENVKGDQGILVYPGVEANIIDEEGTLDLPEATLRKLEFLHTSFHTFAWEDRGIESNTRALVGSLNRYDIKSIAHINYPYYPLDVEALIPILIKKHVAIEINNKALKKYKDNWREFREIILKCKDKGVKFLVNSDAHYPTQVGEFSGALEFIDYAGLYSEDILNTDRNRLMNYLKLRTHI
ncbi:MAG: PHP domain-containing protein [Thermotaleaceae bacterium]